MLFAIELGVSKHIKELNKTISLTRQDDAVLFEKGMEYLSAPQTRLILIKSNLKKKYIHFNIGFWKIGFCLGQIW